VTDNMNIDPSFLRGLTQARMSRRDLLKAAGAGAGVMGLEAFLAACGAGGSGTGGASPQSSSQISADVAKIYAGQPNGSFVFGQWPLYIDKTKNAQGQIVHPSLDIFTKKTGIKVDYQESIQDNGSFFGQVQPQLQAGQSIGYDIIVVTNGEFLTKYVTLGYLWPLDPSKRPNFDKNAAPWVASPTYDPGNVYTMAWQSGITGIGWDPVQVAKLRPSNPKITSTMDLFDPAFKGKVGMFGESSDFPNTGLLAAGVSPETSTEADWQKAADLLAKQKSDGIVRQYYEQNYINALSNGDIAVCQAWSGDIFQTNLSGDSQGLQFLVPPEGALIWTDNMCIPKNAQNPVDAMTYMDYVYQPDVQAMIEEWVNYICPVPSAQAIVEADAATASGGTATYLNDVAKSPLVFPSQADVDKLHSYRVLTADEQVTWNNLFQPIYQG